MPYGIGKDDKSLKDQKPHYSIRDTFEQVVKINSDHSFWNQIPDDRHHLHPCIPTAYPYRNP